MKPISNHEEVTKDSAGKKKFSKPLMERRRRARINDSLNELKSLVLSSMNKDQSKFNKMEKADVLELTVNYLKTLNLHEQAPNEIDQQRNFVSGYNECAREVQLYLLRSAEVSSQVKARMLSHISTSPQEINTRAPSRTEINESPMAAKTGYSQILSSYPSPPASPIAVMNDPRLNNQPTKKLFAGDFHRNISTENRALNFQDLDRRPISAPGKPLWRPWLSM